MAFPTELLTEAAFPALGQCLGNTQQPRQRPTPALLGCDEYIRRGKGHPFIRLSLVGFLMDISSSPRKLFLLFCAICLISELDLLSFSLKKKIPAFIKLAQVWLSVKGGKCLSMEVSG